MNMQGGMGQMPVGVGGGGMPGGMVQGMQGLQGPVSMSGQGMPGSMPGCMPGGGVMQGMAGANPMGATGLMHGPSPQNPGTPGQMQNALPQQQSPEKLDNISKVKSLMGPLRDALMQTMKTAAHQLHQNHLIDAGTIKGVDNVIPRFDKNLEEFYSLCDQIELHLKTAQECINQGGSSSKYLPYPVNTTRTEPMGAQDGNSLTYPQYLATTRAQSAYIKEIQDSLNYTLANIDC